MDKLFLFWSVSIVVVQIRMGRDISMIDFFIGSFLAPVIAPFVIFKWIWEAWTWALGRMDKAIQKKPKNDGRPIMPTPPPQCIPQAEKKPDPKPVITHYNVSLAPPGTAYTKGWEMYCSAQWIPMRWGERPSHTKVEFPSERAAFEAAVMNLPVGAKYQVLVSGPDYYFTDGMDQYIHGERDYEPLTKAQRLRLAWGTKRKSK